MKVSVLLLMICTSGIFANTYSQNTRFTFHLENTTVKEIFELIQEQSEFVIFYKDSHIDVNRKVNLEVDNSNIDQILNQVFEDLNLTYKISDRQIVITPIEEQSYTVIKKIGDKVKQVQKKTITGTVTDEDGAPLPGANVIIEGTTTGTITDLNGNYSLEIPDNVEVLIFSYIGMKTKEVTIAGQERINITLEQERYGLDEMIAVGYGTMKKGDLTGAVSTVKGEFLSKVPTPHLATSLAGKISGVTLMSRTGTPGNEDVDFFIRGKSTFSDGSNSPLVLIDGIERGMNHINPNDIESVSVLKDASSASIYGVKGANGVILITTKRAKDGEAEITYTGNFGSQTPLYLPDRMNSYEYATHLNEAFFNIAELSGGAYTPVYSDQQIASYKDGTGTNTNWWNEVFEKSAPIQTHNISISQGNNRIKYRTSFEILDQKGLYNGSDYKRHNLRANIDGKITDNLSLSLNIAGRMDNRNQAPNDLGVFQNMTVSYPTFEPYIEIDGAQELHWNGLNSSGIGDALYSGYDRNQRNVFESSMSLKYNVPFINGLVANYTYAFDRANITHKVFETPYIYYDGPDPAANRKQSNAEIELTQRMTESTRNTAQFTLGYDKSFRDHTISGLFVFEQSDYIDEWIEVYRDGFVSNALDQTFAGSLAKVNNDGKAFETARIGYAGRANYNYKDKYLVQVNTRYDKSFNFPKDKAGGWFPAFSAAWRLSNESFMSEISWLSNLKIRVGGGIYGNDRIQPYQYLSLFEFSSSGTITSDGFQTAIQPGVIPNPNVTWELAKIANIGIDYGLFRGKISGDIEVFKKRTEDLLLAREDIPLEVGASLAPFNIGIVENKGFEGTIRYKETFGDFKVMLDGNFTYATSKVIEMSEGANVPDGLKETGRPFDSRYGYISLGYFKDANDVANSPDQSYFGNYQSGDIKYKDISGPNGEPDGVIDGNDRTYIGRSGMPEVVFGFNTFVGYKNFELTAFFQGATRYTHYYAPSPFVNNGNGLKFFTDAWTVDNPDASLPRSYQGYSENNKAYSDFYSKDAWFIKLRSAEFAYNVPEIPAIQKIGIKGLRVSVSGSNLLSFSNIKHWDPEAPDRGVHPMYYMQMRTTNFGVQVTF